MRDHRQGEEITSLLKPFASRLVLVLSVSHRHILPDLLLPDHPVREARDRRIKTKLDHSIYEIFIVFSLCPLRALAKLARDEKYFFVPLFLEPRALYLAPYFFSSTLLGPSSQYP